MTGRFADRADAGRQLARAVHAWFDGRGRRPDVVLGLPRGGVVVAVEVARDLGVPLDVAVVRKLGAPWQPELGVGAIGEDGVIVVNEPLVQRLQIAADDLDQVVAAEEAELGRRVRTYTGAAGAAARVPLAGRQVVIVDDGLATGFTALAGVGVARGRGAATIVLAVPVASPEALELLRPVTDGIVALRVPQRLGAVGAAYRDFGQTDDEHVIAALAAARQVS